MSLLDRPLNPRALRLLLVSIVVLCATSAGAATVWHPRCGSSVRAVAHRSEAPRETAAPRPAFRLGRERDASAIRVRVERLLALPSSPSHDSIAPAHVLRATASVTAFEARPVSAGGPRGPPAPPRRSLSS